MPKGTSLPATTTKLLDFFCDDIVIFHVNMQQNACILKRTQFCAAEKTLSFERHQLSHPHLIC